MSKPKGNLKKDTDKTNIMSYIPLLLSKGIIIHRDIVYKTKGRILIKICDLYDTVGKKRFISEFILKQLPNKKLYTASPGLIQAYEYDFSIKRAKILSFKDCYYNLDQHRLKRDVDKPAGKYNMYFIPDYHFDVNLKLTKENISLMSFNTEVFEVNPNHKYLKFWDNFQLNKDYTYWIRNPLLRKYGINVCNLYTTKPNTGKSSIIEFYRKAMGGCQFKLLNDGFWGSNSDNINSSLVCTSNEVDHSLIEKGNTFKELLDPHRNSGCVINTKGDDYVIESNHAAIDITSNDVFPFKADSYDKRFISIPLDKNLVGCKPSEEDLTVEDYENYACLIVNELITVLETKNGFNKLWNIYKKLLGLSVKYRDQMDWDTYVEPWIFNNIINIRDLKHHNLGESYGHKKGYFNQSIAYQECLKNFNSTITTEFSHSSKAFRVFKDILKTHTDGASPELKQRVNDHSTTVYRDYRLTESRDRVKKFFIGI